MNFENWIRRFAPYLVGWYAIASVMDAMFFSMTGLTFFVGDQYVRLALTVLDAAGAVVLHRMLADSDKARTNRSRGMHDEAARAVQSFLAATCTHTDEKDTLRFDKSLVNPYMTEIHSATGTMRADIYTRAMQSQMAREAQYAQSLQNTVHHESASWTGGLGMKGGA